MPKTHLTTARSQRARSSKHLSREMLEFKIRMLHAAVLLLGYQPTPTSILTRSQRLRIGDVRRVTGASSEDVIRRGVDLFLEQEAPVYLA